MNRTKSLLLLRVILVIAGIMFSITGVGAFLSEEKLKALTGLFVGAEQLDAMWPDEGLFDYILRASCIAYFWIGINFFIACKDPVKYRGIIDLAILGFLLFGIVCLVVGKGAGIPLIWYAADSFLSFLGAILLIMLRPE